ncbi:1846_t:CDS:1, partial [Dentiscutata erythropus]
AQLQKKWKELGLGECLKTENLDDCLTLCHDLEQYDLEAVRLPTKEKLEDRPEAGPGPRMQAFRNDNKYKNLINEEFRHLGEMNKGQERLENDLEFREQEIGTAVKRRAVAVYYAKVPKSYPDNGSDI